MESKFSIPDTSNMPPLPGRDPVPPPASPSPDGTPAPAGPAPEAGEAISPQIVSAVPVLSIPPLVEIAVPLPQPLCDWWGKPITPGPLAGQCRPGIDLTWDGYEEDVDLFSYEATIASLKHQLRNSEQAVQFAADLLNKATRGDPKALPRVTSDTKKLRKQIDLARSFLCAADVPPLPLEDQCKWIGAKLITERHARVQAEGKLMAANQMIDDLRKAAGSPAAN
jgi:hypothetical protein